MRVGLTGGIGSGKSTVAGYFQELGVPVYNSDSRAKALMEQKASLRRQIEALLGPLAYNDNKLNRPYVATQVFANPDLLSALNALVHPEVRLDFQEWSEKQESPYVVQEAAILFENGGYRQLDQMVLVTAPEPVRLKRVMKRDGISEGEVRARMSNQWDDARKIPLADFLVDNTRRQSARAQVRKIHQRLLGLAASNVTSDC